MTTQRYVSDELTHFVGRDLMRNMADEEREGRESELYDRLIAILKSGTLAAGGKITGVNADPSTGKGGITVNKVITYRVGSTDLQTMFDAAVAGSAISRSAMWQFTCRSTARSDSPSTGISY